MITQIISNVTTVLYKLETFLFLRRDSCLEEDRIRPVLSVEQRHVAVHLAEQVHALVTLLGGKTVNDSKLKQVQPQTWK